MTDSTARECVDNERIGRWTLEEHKNFLYGYQIHGKSWKQVASYVKTRSVVQVRTHAQKYFQKLQKQGEFNQLKYEEMRSPNPMIKKLPPPEPLPLLQSFNLLTRNSTQEIDFPTIFQVAPCDSSNPVAVEAVKEDGTLLNQSDTDWFTNPFVDSEYSEVEVLTDASDSGSDRKSSFDSTEDEDYLPLEFTAAPV